MRTRASTHPAALWASSALLIAAAPVFASCLLLRELGRLVGLFVDAPAEDGLDFVRIFSQTRHARLTPHVLIPLVLCVLFSILCIYALSRIRRTAPRLTLLLLLLIVLSTVSLVCSLLLTRVNGIRFIDLLRQLLPLIDKL